MRRVFATVVSLAILFAILNLFRIVGITYPRAINNMPLRSPVKVATVTADRITLVDGRVFQVRSGTDVVGDIHASGDVVDVEVVAGLTEIYVTQERGYCGTPWTSLVELPLIPVTIPINRRVALNAEVAEVLPET